MLGPMGRAASMVAPNGFGLPAVRQEGRLSRSRTAPTTAWVDRVGNAQGTVDHGPLSLRSHVFVSVERDLGRFAKRLCAWMFPPELSCEVVQDSTTPGPRGLLSPAWVGRRALLQRAGHRIGGNSPAPAKLSLKRHPMAPAAFYSHTTLNTTHLFCSCKLSRVGYVYYLDGRPPGNTRCCSIFCLPICLFL